MKPRPLTLACLLAGLALCGVLVFAVYRHYNPVPRHEANPVLLHLRPNPKPPGEPAASAAAETVANMFLPEGMRAELVAAEPRVRQPMAFTFDERGRIWVVEAHSYPQKRPEGEGLDSIVIFADRDGDGTFETREVFADGLNLVSGLEVGHGGVWAASAPQLLFFPDADRDDRPDSAPRVVIDGFGLQDTHNTPNNLIWGPDGWLYGCQGGFIHSRVGRPGTADEDRQDLRAGVWRVHPVRAEVEVFAHGGSNQWGLDFNERGQLFMTHCRSRRAGGPTTHVIQGGYYWNATGRHHVAFLSGAAPAGYPFFRNDMRASAQYGHGQGGAGKEGSDWRYGGHVHVGTMIYLGDNWPDSYRDHLLTHNLMGRQMNHQENRRAGSGYRTVHAGQDALFCTDRSYCPIDLKYGPDGAVYVIDWYDRQQCHNPHTERWDRSNGRIYRIAHAKTYQPSTVDLGGLSDHELVERQLHENDWHVRTARRLLAERASTGRVDPAAIAKLRELTLNHGDPTRRLRGLWALHAVQSLDEELARKTLGDDDEYVRAWTIQLATEARKTSPSLLAELVSRATDDPSPVVRLYLAAAIQRLPRDAAWQLVEALVLHDEDAGDANVPLLIWYGLAKLMPADMDRAFRTAKTSRIPVVSSYVYWYAAKLRGEPLDRVIGLLARRRDGELEKLLVSITHALAQQVVDAAPSGWGSVADALHRSENPTVSHHAALLAAKFGDASIFPRLREVLADRGAPVVRRKQALEVLSIGPDAASATIFHALLDEPQFRRDVINLLSRLDHPASAGKLLAIFPSLTERMRASVIDTMSARSSLAVPLLDAVIGGQVDRKHLNAFHVRQLGVLNDEGVASRVERVWGVATQPSAALEAEIHEREAAYAAVPPFAYTIDAGRKHFNRLCGTCHLPGAQGPAVGPSLAGSGRNGVRYFLESIIDPNAVIGSDYQVVVLEQKDGGVVMGIVENETEGAVTVRTLSARVVVPKSSIVNRSKSASLMPPALLDGLEEAEVFELLRFLTTL